MLGLKSVGIHRLTGIAAGVVSLTKNLILSLKGDSSFNKNANTTILDRSVNDAVITRGGDATQTTGSFSPFSSGWSYYFDGSGDYLSFPASTNWQMTSDYTVECWVNPSITPNNFILLDQYAASSAGAGNWQLFINSSGILQFYFDGAANVITTSATIVANRWQHIAATRSGTTIRVFVDGVQVGTTTSSATLGRNDTLWIGAQHSGGPSLYVQGYISNVRIVKGTALYTAAFTPSASALSVVSGTSLLTCHSGRLFDASTNAFDASVFGNTSASTFGPFDKAPLTGTFGSTSVYFDGNGDYLSAPSSTAFDFGTGDFTIECWAYRTAAGTGDRFLVSRGNGANFVLRWNAAGNIQFYLNASVLVHNYTYAFPLNTWVHIAVTRSGSTSKLFINGAEVSSVSNSTSAASTVNAVLVGGYTSSDYFAGNLSNVRIVKGTAVYTAAFTPAVTDLTAVSGTSLLTCQGGAISDNSTNNATITVAGNSRLSSLNPFGNTGTYPGSIYFDGSNDYLTIPSSASLNLLGGDFTVECWFYPIAFNASNYNYLIMQDDGGSDNQNFQLTCGAAGLVSFLTWNTSARASAFGITSTRAVKLGAWNHIAVAHVRSTNTTRLFLNGVLEATSTTATWAGSTQPTCIGNWNNGLGIQNSTYSKLNGYLSGVRLIKGTAAYTSAFAPPTSPPTAAAGTALLLNFNDAGIVDAYGSNAATNFTANSGVVTDINTKKYGSGSLYFNNKYLVSPQRAEYAFGTGDFTVQFWVNLASQGASLGMFQITSTAPTNFAPTNEGIGIVLANGSAPYALNFFIGGAAQTGTISLTSGVWTHVALCRSAGTVRLFVGGVLSKSVASSANLTGQYLTLGAANGLAYGMVGYLDNIEIHKGYALYTTDSSFTPV